MGFEPQRTDAIWKCDQCAIVVTGGIEFLGHEAQLPSGWIKIQYRDGKPPKVFCSPACVEDKRAGKPPVQSREECRESPPFGLFREGFICRKAKGHDGHCGMNKQGVEFTWLYGPDWIGGAEEEEEEAEDDCVVR